MTSKSVKQPTQESFLVLLKLLLFSFQYNFGYQDPNSARTETKTADGVVRGSYNYIDSDGIIQTVHYIADALGFRAAGTTIPVATYDLPQKTVETPEVLAARADHIAQYNQVIAEHDQLRSEDVAREQHLKEVIGYTDYVQEEPVFAQAPLSVEVPALSFPAGEVREINAPVEVHQAPVEVHHAPVTVEAHVPDAHVAPASSQYHAQAGYSKII
jgi:hypothetical protein